MKIFEIMRILKEKKVRQLEVAKILKDTIPELKGTSLKQIDDYLSETSLIFYEQELAVQSPIHRLSIIPALILWVILFILMPVNFIITGYWGFELPNIIKVWFRSLNLH